jgi:formylglycine-generating enzyme required for sulfatase activity
MMLLSSMRFLPPLRLGAAAALLLLLVAAAAFLLIVARKPAGTDATADSRRSTGSDSGADSQRGAESAPGTADAVEKWPREIVNSIGMKLARIPKGTFTMGSPAEEKERLTDEEQHEVEITKDFWLGVHEVTQQQFREVMGYNPSYFSAFTTFGQGKPGAKYSYSVPAAGQRHVIGYDTDDFPVETVSYEEAVELCQKLSALPAEKRARRKYRLPTEAEWEYACRGGVPSRPFHPGNSLSSRQANFDGNFPYGAEKGKCLRRTCKVGRYAPNAWGLCDMHGNVREWCSDWYDADYYGKSPRRDPQGPAEGSLRVIRGGGCSSDGKGCRSAVRFSGAPVLRDFDLGFRVVLVPSDR